MNNYRIITNNKKYRIQKLYLWTFWKTMLILTAYGCHDYLEFDSKKEAEAYIANCIADNQQRKMYKERKWKVIK